MARQKTLHEKLSELGNNLWWSWQPEVTQIFREIDPSLWTDVAHNPVLLLEQYLLKRSRNGPRRQCSTPASIGRTAAGKSTWKAPTPGGERTPVCSAIVPRPISPPSPASTSLCQFIREAWGC